jgi:uncharacterized protein with HEPN domain
VDLRNVIVHQYDQIIDATIFEIVTTDVPRLSVRLEAMLAANPPIPTNTLAPATSDWVML